MRILFVHFALVLSFLASHTAPVVAQSQTFFSMDETTTMVLNNQRDGIEDFRQQLVDRGVIEEAMPIDEVLQVILNLELVSNENIDFQQAIGVAIGDIIIEEQGFFWVMAVSENATVPVVMHPSQTAYITPVTAVTKRFFQGDYRFNVREFIDTSVENALAAAANPESQSLSID